MGRTTIVIPNFNGIKYIENCLRSLEKQTVKNTRVIVVDNGSTDGSKELVKTKFLEVEVIAFEENTGFCHAVNAGIQAAQSEYVILLNNDTVVEPGFVEALELTLDKYPNAFSAAAKMLMMHRDTVLDGAGDMYCALGWAYARGKGKNADRYKKETRIFSACGGAAIYRTSILNQIGCFDSNHFAYLEDMDIGYRAQIFGYINVYAPEAIVRHAGSAVSGSKYNEFKIKLSSKNSIYLIYKNMPLLQIIVNLPILLVGFFIKTLFFVKKGFGMLYVKGLWAGLAFCFTKEARTHKVKFRAAHFSHYMKIQWDLWVNTVKRIAS